MENENQNQEEVVNQEVEQVAENVQSEAQTPEPDRPEINYKAELERRKAETEKLRQELEAERSKQIQRRDQNDISTWSDLELKALKNSQDPSVLPYKDQAEELLLERKVKAIRERERMAEKRATTEVTLRTQYPEALDPSSDFAAKMEQVMYDLDLQKSPAGRLAAARIVAGESSKGSSKSNAAGRKQEEARLKDVKQTLSEGDRPDPRQNMTNPKKNEELINIVNDKHSSHEAQSLAMAELLKQKGISRDSFFKR